MGQSWNVRGARFSMSADNNPCVASILKSNFDRPANRNQFAANRSRIIQAEKVIPMLKWAVIFLIIALVAGLAGMGGLSGLAQQIAWILLVVFLILFVVSLVMGRKPSV